MIQGQWNVVKLGNPAHVDQCKKQRFKNIRIEAVDPTAPSTVPIMTDGIINVSLFAPSRSSITFKSKSATFQSQMDTMVDYDNNILGTFRSNVYDAIMIYGFQLGKASTGIVKAKLKILDGLR